MSGLTSLSSQQSSAELAQAQQFVADTFDLSAGYYSDSLCAFCHQGADVGKHMHSLLHSSSDGLLESDSSGSEDGAARRSSINAAAAAAAAAASSRGGLSSPTPFKRSYTLHLDPKRIWMSVHPLYVRQARIECVHLYCALFAPMSWLKNRIWYNVAREVRRSQHFQCTHCGLKGATLACQHKKCSFVAHLPCALDLGWIPSLMNKVLYLCPTHKQEETNARNEQFQIELRDVSRGREAVEVVAAPPGLDAAMDAPYYYIAENVDSSDISLSLRHVQSLGFCSCGYDGLCSPAYDESDPDATPCPCLKSEQYYLNGPYKCLRLPFTAAAALTKKPERIVECGLRCQCSKRCMNRVVGNGIQFQLSIVLKRGRSFIPTVHEQKSPPAQVQHNSRTQVASQSPSGAAAIATSPGPRKRSRTVNGDNDNVVKEQKQWGIFALQDIPVGAFVCEFVGQYVRGRTHVQVPFQLHSKVKDPSDPICESSIAEDVLSHVSSSRSPVPLLGNSSACSTHRDRGLDGCGSIIPVRMWESDFPLVESSSWCKMHFVVVNGEQSPPKLPGRKDSVSSAESARITRAAPRSGNNPTKVVDKDAVQKGRGSVGGEQKVQYAADATESGVEAGIDEDSEAGSEEEERRDEEWDDATGELGDRSKARSDSSRTFKDAPPSRASGAAVVAAVASVDEKVAAAGDKDAASGSTLSDIRDEKFIDNRYYGNLSRLIRLTRDREECNLLRRCVFIDDTEHLLPRLALFASRPIAKGEELVLF